MMEFVTINNGSKLKGNVFHKKDRMLFAVKKIKVWKAKNDGDTP